MKITSDSKPCQSGSPVALTRFLDRCLNHFSEFFLGCTENGLVLRIAGFALGLLLAFGTAYTRLDPRLGSFGSYEFSFHMAGWLLVGSAILYPRHILINRSTLGAIAMTAAFAGYEYFKKDDYLVQIFIFYVFTSLTIACLDYFWTRWPAWKKVAYIATVFTVIFIFPICIRHYLANIQPTGSQFHLFIFGLLIIATRASSIDHASPMSATRYVLSPIAFIGRPLAIPYQMLPKERPDLGRLAGRGLLNAAGGGLLFLFAGLIHQYVLYSGDVHNGAQYLWRGFTNYLFYFFGWLALAQLAVGLGRWFGYDLVAPAHYSILSANLLDRWRRWHFYLYWMYLTFVWLPVVRRTQSVALAISAVFFADFLWHNTYRLELLIIKRLDGSAQYFDVTLLRTERDILFYILHGFFLYLGFRTRRWWPDEHRLSGWVGVGLTTLSMAIVHGCLQIH